MREVIQCLVPFLWYENNELRPGWASSSIEVVSNLVSGGAGRCASKMSMEKDDPSLESSL